MAESNVMRPRLALFVFLAAAAGTALALIVLFDVLEKQREADRTHFTVVDLTETIDDPSVWGRNFPLHYEDYRKTVDTQRTRFGGSEALPRTPTSDDPRTHVAQSKLDEEPRLREMWAGYAFSIDHREERGHAYMLEDQTFTARHEKPQPGACISCHASTVTAWRELGDGDLAAGAAKTDAMSYAQAREHVHQAVACIDCHDPDTMRLRVTRPAFVEGIRTVKAAEGIEHYEVNRDASREELRTFVCAQCHVEYYFRGEQTQLTYPWDKGRRGDDILSYYETLNFEDWTHARTGASMLKAQHPEFEMWTQGIHARSGVSCVDCHMPYKRVGAMKITDHHVRSPLLNINNACQTCHPVPTDELLARAESFQATTLEMLDQSLGALTQFIEDIEAAQADGMSGHPMDAALRAQRRATFLIDFVHSENSAGFHAPQEAARLLFRAMDELRAGARALGDDSESPRPDPEQR